LKRENQDGERSRKRMGIVERVGKTKTDKQRKSNTGDKVF